MARLVQMEPPGGVTGDFVGNAPEVVPLRDGAAEWTRRCVDMQSVGFAQLVNAEQVGAVADDVDGVKIVLDGNEGKGRNRLLSVVAVGFGNDMGLGNAVGYEVIATDAAF